MPDSGIALLSLREDTPLNRFQNLIRRIGWAVLTIAFVIILNFFLFRILPGDPARAGVHDPRLKKDAVEAIRARFGLDKPVINCFESLNPVKFGDCGVNPLETQFFIYVKNLLTGEMGFSYHTNRPVTEILAERLWNTVLLIGAGQILSVIIGVIFGIAAAWKRDASLPNDTLPTSGSPLQAWPSAAMALSPSASKPGIVDSTSNSM